MKLHINKNPIVSFYPEVNWIFTAYSEEKSPELYKWVYNRFLDMYSGNFIKENDDYKINFLHYYRSAHHKAELLSCVYLYKNKIDITELYDYNIDIKRYIINKLKKNNYVCLNIDRAKLRAYEDSGGVHDVLVFGFDLDKSVFYGIDYFNDSYFEKYIDMDELVNAINEGSRITSFVERPGIVYEEVDITWIVNEIRTFLDPQLRCDSLITGINCLDEYLKYIKYNIEVNGEFSLSGLNLWESYVKLMSARLRYITTNCNVECTDLVVEFEQIYDSINSLKMYGAKLQMKNQLKKDNLNKNNSIDVSKKYELILNDFATNLHKVANRLEA